MTWDDLGTYPGTGQGINPVHIILELTVGLTRDMTIGINPGYYFRLNPGTISPENNRGTIQT